jgi:hypothetical protein
MEEKSNKVTVTRGMANAKGKVSRTCGACGLKVPVYPGRYSNKCSDCGEPFQVPSAQEQIDMVKQGADPKEIAKDIWEVDEGIASDISGAFSKVRGAAKGAKARITKGARGAKKGLKGLGRKKKKDDDEEKKK